MGVEHMRIIGLSLDPLGEVTLCPYGSGPRTKNRGRVLVGSWVLGPGSWVLGPGSWVLVPRSWVVGRGSWVVGRGSWVVGRGSWVRWSGGVCSGIQ